MENKLLKDRISEMMTKISDIENEEKNKHKTNEKEGSLTFKLDE